MKAEGWESRKNGFDGSPCGVKQAIHTYCLLLLCAVFVQGCALIDDDLSVCGTDFKLEIQMQLITNLDLELETTLSAETDVYTRTVLHNYFSHIFTDHAHDISIGFYNTTDDELVYAIHDTIDASQSTYTFFLPKNNYYAIALANLDGNEVVTQTDETNSRLAKLETPSSDTLPSQQTGLFTASLETYVQDTADQKIDIVLHMANCAFALVIDTNVVHIEDIRGILCGMGDGLVLRDSLFTHNKPKTTRMERIEPEANAAAGRRNYGTTESRYYGSTGLRNDGTTELRKDGTTELRTSAPQEEADTARYCLFGCVSFPSPDEANLGTYYQAKVYVDKSDGTTTETVLSMYEPLHAGQLKIVKLDLQSDGSVVPVGTTDVGASVTLNWQEGNTFNPSL